MRQRNRVTDQKKEICYCWVCLLFVALDGSIYVSDTAQLLIYVRTVSKECTIHEDLVAL